MSYTEKDKRRIPFHIELFISIASLFITFILVIFFTQFNLDKETRKGMLNSILQDYNNLVYREYSSSQMTEAKLDSIIASITDKNLRVTITTLDGKVITDSGHNDSIPLPNHKKRPIKQFIPKSDILYEVPKHVREKIIFILPGNIKT